ncbi:hypothetical protein FACS189435_3810 [Bacteroidia bacterium]|nr:hypothetical protein FACS189435_3810 [Bacteroidia bacterium]
MLKFPNSTYWCKRMPKEKFYTHLEVPATIRQSFVNDIDLIVWQNKLSATTLNLAPGNTVKEIALLEVKLKKQNYNKELFQFISRNIALYVLFLLKYESQAQLLIHYKEPIANKPGTFKIIETYTTDWMDEQAINLTISGLDMDVVYHSFIKQIGKLEFRYESLEFRDGVEHDIEKKKIERQISLLESKLRTEQQFNKQLEIADKIKKLKKKIYG